MCTEFSKVQYTDNTVPYVVPYLVQLYLLYLLNTAVACTEHLSSWRKRADPVTDVTHVLVEAASLQPASAALEIPCVALVLPSVALVLPSVALVLHSVALVLPNVALVLAYLQLL